MKPILVCRTSWMDNYKGAGGDKAVGGGQYVTDFGFGHELYNFLSYEGRYYGFVTIPSAGRGANIVRLGASPNDESISGVLVIWVATHPVEGGMRVVGWYEDATVFKSRQPSPTATRTMPNGSACDGYVVSAEKAVLLDRDERLFRVAGGTDGIGQMNVWYPNPERAEELRGYVEQTKVGNVVPRPQTRRSAGGRARMRDVARRQRIERKAMDLAEAWFEARDFTIEWKQRENLGWDLEARRGGIKLLVEVKGTSMLAASAGIEVTPNEYAKMNDPDLRARFRLFVATEVEAAPEVFVFSYSPEVGAWTAKGGTFALSISPSTSATLRLRSQPTGEIDG